MNICYNICVYIYIYTHIVRLWQWFSGSRKAPQGSERGAAGSKCIYIYIYTYTYTYIYIYIYMYMYMYMSSYTPCLLEPLLQHNTYIHIT